MACFMSGMAGNVTAFNTVWTYDIYQCYIRRGAVDQHYLWMGRMATVFGIVMSVAAAYRDDAIQQHHGHAPARLCVCECAAVRHVPAGNVLEDGRPVMARSSACSRARWRGDSSWTDPAGRRARRIKGGWFGVVPHLSERVGPGVLDRHLCLVGLFPDHDSGQPGYEAARGRRAEGSRLFTDTARAKEDDLPWYQRPAVLAVIILIAAVILNIIFW